MSYVHDIRIDRISTARAGVMVSVGMSDQEMTSYIKETFCVDSTYEAKQLSWGVDGG